MSDPMDERTTNADAIGTLVAGMVMGSAGGGLTGLLWSFALGWRHQGSALSGAAVGALVFTLMLLPSAGASTRGRRREMAFAAQAFALVPIAGLIALALLVWALRAIF